MRGLALVVAAALLGPAGIHATAGSSRTLEGVPAYRHVVLLLLENEDEPAAFGPASPAAYLRSLAERGALADEYYATGHVSLDNYIAITSGQPANPATATDCLTVNLHTCAALQQLHDHGRNIADQVEEAGLSWRQYSDGTPSPCFHADYSPAAGPDPYIGQGRSPAPGGRDYADRHVPFVYYPDVVGRPARCNDHLVPYTRLGGDLSRDALPAYSFITPDTCHDGHDDPCSGGGPGGLRAADAWLRSELPPLLTYLATHQGLLIITFDEGALSSPTGCCAGGPAGGPGFGGRVGLLALGAGVSAHVVHTPYDHASLLRTTEDALGITEHLGNASRSAAMRDLFDR
jgi:hypothetical protein